MTDPTCTMCADSGRSAFTTPITMAFQPIFDVETGEVFAQEALVRGTDGASAGAVLAQVTAENKYSFDQKCRVKAIQRAAQMGVTCNLSINFMPNAIYDPRNCLRTTFRAAETYGFPADRIVFEFLETEAIEDMAFVKEVMRTYRQLGFRTAIDDFGAGYSGLNHLVDIAPDIVKVDRNVISGVDVDPRRGAILKGMKTMCDDLGVMLIAEGVETRAELAALRDLGVRHFQGYLFARPSLDRLTTRMPEGLDF